MEEESSNNYDNDFNDGVKQRYKQYERKRRQEKLLKTAFINFLKNPADSDGQVLDEFLQLCFVSMKNAKSIPSFDVCYKEIAE
ncbi:uncharacterized protein LOC108733201 isoform X2 [Agrilus planipennis]|uniref:Uncharacterized protein LOC108733201 isoform X2 n=1 Tax=Agrilus planipennis TaxID=224129 RepID=A0A1W4W6R3_AGRPL|nr:uncharacterized protein LOC108733201 isoform X2 [Agrilus planipennis]